MVIFHALGLMTKLRFREGHGFGNRYRSEFGASRHITQRIDGRLMGLELKINGDVTFRCALHCGICQAEVFNQWFSSGCKQHCVEHLYTIAQVCCDPTCWVGLQRHNVMVEPEIDSFFTHLLSEKPTDVLVETFEKEVAPIALQD